MSHMLRTIYRTLKTFMEKNLCRIGYDRLLPTHPPCPCSRTIILTVVASGLLLLAGPDQRLMYAPFDGVME